MGKKILLTGSNGFLGSYILNEFSDYSIKGLSRNRSCYNVDLSKNIPFFEESFDLIIHCAGIAHFIPKNNQQSNLFFDVNVVGSSNLLIGLSKTSLPKQFVYISSVSVYGLYCGLNINELNDLNANDPYGKSKIEAEKIIKKWCEEHNVICTILRLPLIVGANPPGNLGAMIHGIKKGYYFNIAGGNAKKSMVQASDIAKFILKAAEVGGTYNLTDGIHPSFYELSKIITQQFGKSFVPNMPFFIAKVLAKFGDLLGNSFPINTNKLSKITSTLTFDDSKARIAFGWNPTAVLENFKLHDNA
jgi:nucleoside-diphosphate-sugar epimerase